ncbi:MAG TPA: homocysteine S-methyltransferase family protein [Phycisphaerales bacterium]|nr:homocysteine S-methyltransferase family protein [Phycisphaerales bacterium]HRQ75352.1 homocysteine S-methyltransferase family protein [Phycisphaerales bacterium]
MGLPAHGVLLLDGATGTELGRRGVDLSPPLWTARALIEKTDLVRRVHREYLESGADAITTCTFRTHRRTLEKVGLGHEWSRLTALAVELACEARDDVNTDALVFGSVAPLEDCYTPHAAPRAEVCAYEHEAMIRALLDAGVDFILIETIGSLREAIAAAEVAQQLSPGRWIISFLTKSVGPPGVLLDGDTIIDALDTVRGAAAIGVNCIPPAAVERNLRLMRSLLGSEPNSPRLIAYANTGSLEDDGTWRETDAAKPDTFADYAMRWVDAGASIIGGCCGTSPDTIRAIRRYLEPHSAR